MVEAGESDAEEPTERDEAYCGEDEAARVADVGRDQAADRHHNGLGDSSRELEKGCVDAVEAETLDERRGEVGHAAVDDAAANSDS